MKLLIIEDDVDQRELIKETLEHHFGHGTVVEAESCASSLLQPLADFDLILADYNLPDANGLQLLKAIQERCNTPVIMVTGENVGHIAAEAIQQGATDYVVKVGDYLFTIPLVVQKSLTVARIKHENEKLRVELEAALSEVRTKNTQLEESLIKVEQMAATDPLTGLYNRRHFSRVLEQLFAEANRYRHDIACVMIDLDGYKQLNDKFGHQLGDELLVSAGRVISANMRQMDVAARYGGDEFILLLPYAGTAQAATMAQRIAEEYRHSSSLILRRETGVTMSIGVASLIDNRPPHADQLIACADAALYQAKEAGRNRIVVGTDVGRQSA